MALGSGYPMAGAQPKPKAPPKPPKRAPPSRRPGPKRPGRPGPGRPPAPMPRPAPPRPKGPGKTPGRPARETPRGPGRVPFGKPARKPVLTPRVPGKFVRPRLPSPLNPFFDPIMDVPGFFLPKKEYTIQPPPGWTQAYSCPPNSLYGLPPSFASQRVNCGSVNIGCLTLQPSPSPGTWAHTGPTTCSVVNNCMRVIVTDMREISAGTYRGHYRYVYSWNCTALGNPAWPLDPQNWYVPPRPIILPMNPPDPWAEQMPGQAQPMPVAPPAWAPDPNSWIPGGAIVVRPRIDIDPFVWVDPQVAPEPAVQPDPAPHPLPDPNPQPDPAPNPQVQPRPRPFPFPAPNPGTDRGPTPQPGPKNNGWDHPWPRYDEVVRRDGATRRRFALRPHRMRPPKPREKEKKIRAGRLFLLVQEAIGHLTEGADLVDVLWKSIPCAHKRAGGMIRKGVRVGEKAEFIAKFHVLVDGKEFQRNFLKNQFEDMFYGMTSPERAYYQQLFEATGVSGGGKFAGGSLKEKYERELREHFNIADENPVIDAFNRWLDDQYGPVPDAFKC